MNTTTLQVPLSKSLKSSATSVAKEYGFSSLQEIVRVLLTKLARKELSVSIQEEPVTHLSKKAEKRYLKMDEDFDKGKNVYVAGNIEDLMRDLNS